MTLREKLTYRCLRLLSAFFSRISNRSAVNLSSRIGSFIFRYVPLRKKEAFNHLEVAFPNRPESYYNRILKKVYHHFAHELLDLLRIDTLKFERIAFVSNHRCLIDAISEGKGIILLTGHLGNWEMIPWWLASKGYEIYALFRKLKNRGADKFLFELRRQIGGFPLYAKTPPQKLLKILRDGKIVGLVSDQDARRRGVFVKFFNTPTSTPKGAAIFHLKTGAPLILGLCCRNRDGTYHLKFERIPTEVEKGDAVSIITQRFTSRLEGEIRNHPEQYFWFHRRWKTKPPSI